MSILISIEGNIGAGKSTLIHQIQDYFENNVVFIQEPIHEWNTIKNKDDKTILECFYENQEKYAFSFQMMAYISRIAALQKAIEDNPDSILIVERSVYTDKFVFAKMLYDNKQIHEIEYQIYLKWYDFFLKKLPAIHTIYLRTNPNICLERIKKRNREGEENMDISYLEECHKYHEDWIYTNIDVTNTLIITANADRDKEDYSDIINLIKENIQSWLHKNKNSKS